MRAISAGLLLSVLVTVSALSAHQGAAGPGAVRLGEPVERILWVDPDDPSRFDFQYGVGGSELQPQPPFRFLSEDLSRSTPKANIVDGRGFNWNIKWGIEAGPSAFCTRLIRACGYLAEAEYFLDEGRLEGVRNLTRARRHVSEDGSFEDARFQLRAESPKYLDGHHWTLKKNPFLGTPEFQGLKILILLLSNWDTRESNFGIFLDSSGNRQRYLYVHTDWGAALGHWGNAFTRTKGECRDFAEQTTGFVKGLDHGVVKWGFGDMHDIRVADVRWILQYLGEITDAQLRLGLASSGKSPQEADCYTRALRQRIVQLREVADR
ncbi:MAG TPA: hypothetical protein VFY29_19980 [Terriglobia bacterium]|nr:hypothetical protein [Terriglobia bacterium]